MAIGCSSPSPQAANPNPPRFNRHHASASQSRRVLVDDAEKCLGMEGQSQPRQSDQAGMRLSVHDRQFTEVLVQGDKNPRKRPANPS
jgi:hypothetical protein